MPKLPTTKAAADAPILNLLGYQKRFLADRSRFKIGLWSRQTGKSFTSAVEAVLDCVEQPRRLWIVLSAGERQSLEWMEKAKLIARAYGLAAEVVGDTFEPNVQRLSITFPNGSRIIGLPANASTARGYSGNVILDEFAFHEDSRAIWRGLVPSITRGYRLIVLSTPNGQANVFYDLWQHHPEFSKHRVTILDAQADGLAVNLDELRAAIDPEGWQQEYLCEFVDEATALLSYELISTCEDPGAVLADGVYTDRDPVYLGVDVGRKHDLSVIWALQRVGDVYWTRDVRVLEKMTLHHQFEILDTYLRLRQTRRCCIDQTGIGLGLAEEAQRYHGTYRVEGVQFSAPVKEELAMTLLPAFQDKRVRIPQDRAVREDLHKVRKVTTMAGNVRYLADRDDAGHSDRFWALALALHAGATAGGPVAWAPLADAAAGPDGARARHPVLAAMDRAIAAARTGAAGYPI